MKTEDLVVFLATGSCAVESHATRHRLFTAIGAGLLGSIVLMYFTLGLLPNLLAVLAWPKFWMKVAFSGSLAVGGFVALSRLGRPGSSLGYAPVGIGLPIVFIWGVIAYVLSDANHFERLSLLLGKTWMVCPFLIAMLSTPIFVGTFWAARYLAPTRLSLCGASIGLLSGATGALVYTLHCPEMEAPFIGTWYLLGVLIPTAIGALLGRSLLRW